MDDFEAKNYQLPFKGCGITPLDVKVVKHPLFTEIGRFVIFRARLGDFDKRFLHRTSLIFDETFFLW